MQRSGGRKERALGECRRAGDYIERIMADVIFAHLVLDHVLRDDAFLDAFLEQREEQPLLVGVGMLLVLAEEGIFAE